MKLATLLADMIGLLAENGWFDGAVLAQFTPLSEILQASTETIASAG
ncbi:hypothetical protein [Oricola indica]